MAKSSIYDRYYDKIFYLSWEFTTGNPDDCYEAARHFALFCKMEIERQIVLEDNKETALVRRGLIAAPYIMKSWVFNVIEDCTLCKSPVPMELLEVLYYVLDCKHMNENSQSREIRMAQHDVLNYKEKGLKVPVRQIARRTGVNPSSVSRWVADPELEFNEDRQKMIRKLTNLDEFLKSLPRPWNSKP